MKQIFTLVALLASTTLFAQTTAITADFNNSSLPAGACWINNGLTFKMGLGNTNNSNTINISSDYASLITPFIVIPANGTVSFGVSSSVQKNADARIRVSTIAMDGTVTLIGTAIPKKDFAYSPYTSPVATPGTYRILIEFVKPAGVAPQEETTIDNLSITGTYAAYDCNTAPDAVNDSYAAPLVVTYTSSSSVLANDIAAAGETLTPSVVSSPDGTVIMEADGNFTFKPNPSFAGGLASFTYQITDNGFAPLSDVATVTINFPAAGATTLPVKLLNFQGKISANKAQLTWKVAENETGDYFQILRSTDGRTYVETSTVFVTNKVGVETYTYVDNKEVENTAFYKLKIVNKDHSVSYSSIISLKEFSETKNSLTLLQNPVTSTLHFTYTANQVDVTNVSLYNAAGIKVLQTTVSSSKGLNTASLNMANSFSTGVYILEVINGNERSTARIIKK